MFSNWIGWVLGHFGLAMCILAVVFILLNKMINKNVTWYEIVYRWTTLLPLGITAIYAFVMHAFFSDLAAVTIGWQNSPFQFEVAMANLAFGTIAILSFKASYGFRIANVVANTCWLWGDAVGHIYQMIAYHNFAPGNAGSWLWMDVLMPLILIVCIIQLRLKR
jgi:hypothetical protein